MFEYFPDNYSWSLSAHMAANMGGEISEIDETCRPLKALAAEGESHAQEWFEGWKAMADRLERLAADDEAAGHLASASRKRMRAATYLLIGERQILDKSEETMGAYKRGVELFQQAADGFGLGVERVEVPFGDSSMPALFRPAAGDQPAPTLIHFSGLDVNKEIIFLQGAKDLADYGISVLVCDHPGVGESLRFRDLHATYQSEIPASACVDYLEGRDDVDSQRIGLMALSLGGYYAPRAAAFEERLRCCILWGAIWSMPELMDFVRNQPGSEESVPLEEQFRWVMGLDSIEETVEELQKWELAEVMDRIRVPILTLHGANDRQSPLTFAERTHEAAVNSPRRELKVLQLDEGGAEHCQADNTTMGTDYMFAWAAEVLGADPSGRSLALSGQPDASLIQP
jgi:pimeloyl-ACP methyl ester carboxylesterase